MKTTIISILLICLSALSWAQLQPTGYLPGHAFTPYIYVSDSTVLASINGRLFRSADNGQNWSQVTNGIGPGSFGSRMIASADGVLFLSSDEREHFYRSEDNGITWQPANNGIENVLSIQSISNIVSKEGHIFIGHNFMLMHSTDQGLTWQETQLSNYCNALAVLDEEIWVAQENQVHYSTDNGQSWSAILETPQTAADATVICLAKSGNRIFAGLSYDDTSALKYSDNHGQSWHTAGAFGIVKEIYLHEESLFLISQGSIFKSNDNGLTWEQSELPLTNVFDFSFNEEYAWLATVSGPVRIDDQFYAAFQPEITLGNATALESIGETLYCLSYSSLYKSTNNGDTWQDISQVAALADQDFSSIQSQDQTLLVTSLAQQQFAAVSTNDGLAFEEIPLTPHETAAQFMFGDRLISYSYTETTFWFTDNLGQNWQEAVFFPTDPEGIADLNCIRTVGGELIAGFKGGVAISDNNGENWLFYSHPDFSFSSIAGWSGKIVALASNVQTGEISILKSTDSGQTWSEIESGFAIQSEDILPVCLTMINERIYCAQSTSPYSEDASKIYGLDETGNWFEVPELGVPPMHLQSMVKTNSGIFAGLWQAGVWRMQDMAFEVTNLSGKNHEVLLFPNPVESTLHATHNFDTETLYNVRDLNGKKVISGESETRELLIQTDNLKPGIYILTLQCGNRVVMEKFVKCR